MRPGLLPLLFMLLPFSVAASPMGPPVSMPVSDAVVLQLDEVAQASAGLSVLSADQLVRQMAALIERSRETGSPRPLGLAQGLMASLPEQQWTEDVYLMRATLLQRLHRFDEAEADLQRVLTQQPDNRQAWLTRYSIARVRDDKPAASEACQQLTLIRPDLLAKSCTYELASYGEKAEQAFNDLRDALVASRFASAIERDYALVTLADIASRLDVPEAGFYWQRSLLMMPGDLYRRARYADWLLGQSEAAKAVQITEGYEHIDTLAVLRAIALKRTGHPHAVALTQVLEQRFAEARWRGESLHQWEYARFILDVREDPQAALAAARENWETQRGDADRELLMRAASAANEPAGLTANVRSDL